MKTIDLDKIENAARMVGGRDWYYDGLTDDGLTLVHDCVGGSLMHPIEAETFEAQFIEAANPAVVLELIQRIRSLRSAINELMEGKSDEPHE